MDINLNKQGKWFNNYFSEFSRFSLRSDNIHIEPDNSLWIHIFHHNNPASNKFSSSDDFTKPLYKTSDMWFDFSLCNELNTWEFLIIESLSLENSERKKRWIQSINPMIAVFGDVDYTDITYITGN